MKKTGSAGKGRSATPAPTARKKRKNNVQHRKRAKRSRTLFAVLLFLFVIAVIITLSLTVFFKIETIEVTGETEYNSADIVQATGVSKGDNLFQVSSGSIQSKIMNQFLFIDSVTVTKKMPGTLMIEVSAAKPKYALENKDGFITISERNKILGVGSELLPQAIVVKGVKLPEFVSVGQVLKLDKKDALTVPDLITSQFAVSELTAMKQIDITDLFHITVSYEDRLTIKFGDETQLEYKAKLAAQVIKTKILPEEKGTVDAQIIGEIHFLPDKSQ